jgi:hypothetical protein
MLARMLIVLFALVEPATRLHAANPDDPAVPVPRDVYRRITSGVKSYRPVEPLPWADVNRRVAPREKRPPANLRSQHKH